MELELLSYVKQVARMHYGINEKDMRKLTKGNKWDENQLAGLAWLRGFVKLYSNQNSLRKPEATSLVLSTSFDQMNVQTFFTNLKRVHEKYGPFDL
ncbi:hypothetical protein JTB14_034227 [Gonioctena quinquepunctata]|nr:hypothetical protein JTB14_034227 [Gonioctena quinquepunctata]